ncbi:MAG TPA: helix-turn-helix domain-containing protein [Acidimicrobiales bacterium]|nr:helix-turn-helix domain-containing protein [Acidimicrobiales bacterium]
MGTTGGTDPLSGALLRRHVEETGLRANSRAALVEAAVREFSEKGYEATTVAAIAERAGVTTGAVYAHFGSKLDLLLAASGLTSIEEINRFADDLASLPRAAAASWLIRGLGAPPDGRMVLLLDAIVVARRNPRIGSALRAGLDAYVAAATRAIENARVAGAVSPAIEGDDVARLLAVISLGMTVFAALASPPPSAEAFALTAEQLIGPVGDLDSSPSQAPLDRVSALAAAARRADAALGEAVVDAVDAGHSLREVGAAAGRSHEAVRSVLRRQAQLDS